MPEDEGDLWYTAERERLIWMLSLLSVQHTHSCLENKLRRSQEGQQWVAWTPQRENKVHQLCAAQLSFPCLPLALLGPAAQPGARGQKVDFYWTAFSQGCQGKSKRALKAQRSTCLYETQKLLFVIMCYHAIRKIHRGFVLLWSLLREDKLWS